MISFKLKKLQTTILIILNLLIYQNNLIFFRKKNVFKFIGFFLDIFKPFFSKFSIKKTKVSRTLV